MFITDDGLIDLTDGDFELPEPYQQETVIIKPLIVDGQEVPF